ncbi:MAG TPA: nitroreductase family protein, partial [Cellvibrionaceae bacterium]|nr:nitroreductase family protein [Cellvibrionaceae bacterium]
RVRSGVWRGTANVLDRRHFYRWPIIDEVATACEKPRTQAQQVAYPQLPPPLALECREPAARLLRQRRSAQAFDRTTPIALQDFFALLDHLLPRQHLPPWDCLESAPAIHLVLFVHRVEGLACGLYALARSQEGLQLLQEEFKREFSWQKVTSAPDHLPLYHLITGKAERMAARLACQQAIASDSAFALAMLAEFSGPLSQSPWRYNQLYQEAGLIGQSLYIDAEAIGLRGTGIGCFFDEGVHEVLGINSEALQSLYHFTLGGPIIDTRIISLPPYPERT